MTRIGSAAVVVGIVAVGATLMTRPPDSALPEPATRPPTTGIVRAEVGFSSGTFQVALDRDTRVESNVRYSVVTPSGQRQELGGSSTNPKPGQKSVPKPDATWGSTIVDGHPVIIGLFPSTATSTPTITFADGRSYGVGTEDLKGTAYRMFAVDFPATARPTEIASIRWSGANGVLDGIEGGHRLSGRVLPMSRTLFVEVVLRPTDGGRVTVFGQSLFRDSRGGLGFDLSAATTDPSGVAIVTGRAPTSTRTAGRGGRIAGTGAPIAAGILPAGSSDIVVDLTTNESATGLAKSRRLDDGSVIFAVNADFGRSSDPGKDSIKAVTWTNADGSKGRKEVSQKQP